jgi:hypothetical protein
MRDSSGSTQTLVVVLEVHQLFTKIQDPLRGQRAALFVLKLPLQALGKASPRR